MDKTKKVVDIFLWFECNQKCIFCFQEKEKNNLFKADLPNVLKALIKWRNLWIKTVNISWWEATIYPELEQILRLTKKFGYTDVRLYTNWIKLSDYNYTKKIIPYVNEIVISIHWPNSEIHDQNTLVPWSFNKTIKWVHNIRKMGSNVRIINNFVINITNFKYIDTHIEKMLGEWFDRVDILGIIPNTYATKDIYVKIEIIKSILVAAINKYKEKIQICHIQPCYFKWYEKNVSECDDNKNFISNNNSELGKWLEDVNMNKKYNEDCNTCAYMNNCKWFRNI